MFCVDFLGGTLRWKVSTAGSSERYSHRSTHMSSGWWQLKYFFYFHPLIWGNDPIWRAYFSKGLKPPTSHIIHTHPNTFWGTFVTEKIWDFQQIWTTISFQQMPFWSSPYFLASPKKWKVVGSTIRWTHRIQPDQSNPNRCRWIGSEISVGMRVPGRPQVSHR